MHRSCGSDSSQTLRDRKRHTIEKPGTWPLLAPLIGDTVETAAILGRWTELMRLKASIETGAAVSSVYAAGVDGVSRSRRRSSVAATPNL
jgi:hypothetical protein